MANFSLGQTLAVKFEVSHLCDWIPASRPYDDFSGLPGLVYNDERATKGRFFRSEGQHDFLA